jgi:hypothetical protein
LILDRSKKLVATRTPRVDWMATSDSLQKELAALIELLVGEELKKPHLQLVCQSESRGPHFKCIIGYQRQSKEVCYSVHLYICPLKFVSETCFDCIPCQKPGNCR